VPKYTHIYSLHIYVYIAELIDVIRLPMDIAMTDRPGRLSRIHSHLS